MAKTTIVVKSYLNLQPKTGKSGKLEEDPVIAPENRKQYWVAQDGAGGLSKGG